MTGKLIRGLVVAGMGLGSLVGFAGAAAAAPVLTGVTSVTSSVMAGAAHYQSAVAECPAGKKVVGGGGSVVNLSVSERARLTLTQIEPKDDVDGNGNDGYVVSAAETSPGVAGNWRVQAYAVCADAASVPGWHINVAFTGTDSSTPKQQIVGCDNPVTQRVTGTGAAIGIQDPAKGQVGLQVMRASGLGDAVRARSQEDADGYTGVHWLGAYAICMNTPQGYDMVNTPSDEQGSQDHKSVYSECVGGRPLGAGASVPDSTPPHVSLQTALPAIDGASAVAFETTATPQSWGPLTAQVICADEV